MTRVPSSMTQLIEVAKHPLLPGPHLTDHVAVIGGFERPLLGDADEEHFLLDLVQDDVGAVAGRPVEVIGRAGDPGDQNEQARDPEWSSRFPGDAGGNGPRGGKPITSDRRGRRVLGGGAVHPVGRGKSRGGLSVPVICSSIHTPRSSSWM